MDVPTPRSGFAAHPVAAGAAGALIIAFSALLVELSDGSPSTVAVFRCAYALPFLGVLMVREQRRHGRRPWRDRRLGAIAGVFFGGDLVIWHHSIDMVGTGLATVLGNTQVVIVGLVAWAVLGERPERRVLAAVPVVLTGVVLISGVVGEGAFGRRPVLGAVLGVLTGIAYAGFLLVLRHGQRDLRRPAGPLFDASAVAAVVAALAGLAFGDLSVVPTWPSHGWLLLLAVSCQVVAWLLISVSLPRLPAVVTSIVLMLQPVGAMIIGVVVLAEAPSAFQIAGVLLIIAGVVAATAGRRRAPRPAGPVDAPAVADASVTDPSVADTAG